LIQWLTRDKAVEVVAVVTLEHEKRCRDVNKDSGFKAKNRTEGSRPRPGPRTCLFLTPRTEPKDFCL